MHPSESLLYAPVHASNITEFLVLVAGDAKDWRYYTVYIILEVSLSLANQRFAHFALVGLWVTGVIPNHL